MRKMWLCVQAGSDRFGTERDLLPKREHHSNIMRLASLRLPRPRCPCPLSITISPRPTPGFINNPTFSTTFHYLKL